MAVSGVCLEVCVDDVQGLAAAVAGSADRIELCAALPLGGLTPAPGLIAAAAALTIPVHAMIRPRIGGFELDAADLDAMRRDMDAMRSAGLAGVVFGASLASGALDVAALRVLCDHAAGLDRTLHRAFDLAPEPGEALEAAIELGFARILTSGGQTNALAGLDAIAATVVAARDRIAVMPGGGVTRKTVAMLLARTEVREVHASCSVAEPTPARTRDFGFAPPQTRTTSRQLVADMVHALREIGV